eukprot:841361-Amphidinium_carterae.1
MPKAECETPKYKTNQSPVTKSLTSGALVSLTPKLSAMSCKEGQSDLVFETILLQGVFTDDLGHL